MPGGKRSGRIQENSPEQLAAARKSSMEKRKQNKKRKACAAAARLGEPLRLMDLPDNVLLRIAVKAGFPHRLSAMQVCKRLNSILHHPRFTRTVLAGQTVMETVRQARAGDTIVVPPGLYDEMVLFEKPVKIVGQPGETVKGEPRRGVVFQSSRSVTVLCNARCSFRNIVFRSNIATTDRSICSFGPQCDYLRFDNCEFGGFNGLMVPRKKAETTKLVLLGCLLQGITAPLSGVVLQTGFLRMEGCTVTNCHIALDIYPSAAVYVRNNDISFNETAMIMHGRGVISDNILWGNARRSPIEVSIERINEMSIALANGAEAATFADLVEEGDDIREDPLAMVRRFVEKAEAAQQGPGSEAGPPGTSPPPRVYISGNHVRSAGLRRERPPDEAAVRRRVRLLAAATYGAREEYWNELGGSEGEDWTDEEDDDDDSDIDLHPPDHVADVEELAPLDSDLDFDEDDEDEDDDDLGSEPDADDEEGGHGDGAGAPFFPPHPDDWSDEGWDDAEGWEGEDEEMDDFEGAGPGGMDGGWLHGMGDPHGGAGEDDDLSSLEDALDAGNAEELENPGYVHQPDAD